VHGERVADRRLHQEPVEDRAVVAVVVEAVDQSLVEPGLAGLRAPHDALVQTLPMAASDDLDPTTSEVMANCSLVVVVLAVIPWRYVWRTYVRAPGDAWP
jgi:hypothetical protein